MGLQLVDLESKMPRLRLGKPKDKHVDDGHPQASKNMS